MTQSINKIEVLAPLSFLLFLLSCGIGMGPVLAKTSLVVEALPVRLDPDDPGRKRFGRLTFLAGFELKAEDSRFGGLSGLALSSDGDMLYAVSDRAGSAMPKHLCETGMVPFSSPLKKSIVCGDILLPRLSLVRCLSISRLRPTSGRRPAMADSRGSQSLLMDVSCFLRNSMKTRMEASKGGFLKTVDSSLFLTLERRYNLIGSPATRIQLVSRESLQPGARLKGKEIIRIERPLVVDNFEGMAVREDPQLGTFIYLISDDNYNPFQQTLLLQFRLDTASRN
jgi:hypothetical protein